MKRTHLSSRESDALKFDTTLASLRSARAGLGPQSISKLRALEMSRQAAWLFGDVPAHFPVAELHHRHDQKDRRHRSFWVSMAANLRVHLYADVPELPPVEHSYFLVLVTVFNGLTTPVSGTLKASIDGKPNEAPVFATYEADQIQAGSTFQVCLAVKAPSAGIGHQLRVMLLSGADEVVAETVCEFSCVAAYVLSIDSAHVYEARSVQNDTLLFGSGEPCMNEYGDYRVFNYGNGYSTNQQALRLGDHSDGDDVPIAVKVAFTALPDEQPIEVIKYFLANSGQIRSENSARILVGQIMLAWDLLGGAVTAGADADTFSKFGAGPATDIPGPLTLSVSSILWYEIALRVLTLNCNGVVAAESVVMTGADLDANTKNGNPWTETIMFNGSDSPIGCGAKSKYSVTRTVRRVS